MRCSIMKGKRGQMWLESMATGFELVIAGALLLFFINQGIMIARGTDMPANYYAHDLALSLETAAALQAQKMVINYSREELEEYRIEVGELVSVEKSTGIESATRRLIRVPTLVNSRAVNKKDLSVIKLGDKVMLVDEPVNIGQLVLGSGPVSRIQIVRDGGVVAYETS